MRGAPPDEESAEQRLRENLLELIAFRRMKQAELADALGRSQSWVSKRLSGKEEGGSRFQLTDLDALARLFGLSPAELLSRRHGKWDRRCNPERRNGYDRRRRTPSNENGEAR